MLVILLEKKISCLTRDEEVLFISIHFSSLNIVNTFSLGQTL